MHIGILQTGHTPDAMRGEFEDYGALFQTHLGAQGLTTTVWSVVDGEMPDSVTEAEGWLITGSRHGAYEDHPWIPPLEAFIRDARDAQVPMVGICFGHQIIAQALGGTVEKYQGGWSVGPTLYRFTDTLGEVALNAWHQDQVIAPPQGAETVAASDICKHAALVYGDWGWSVQPHPEFDAAFAKGLITHRGRGLVPDDQLASATRAVEDTPVEKDRIFSHIAEFFRKPRGPHG